MRVGAGKAGAGDAVVLVKKAVRYLRAHGKEKMLAEVNNPNGSLRDRELYFIHSFIEVANAKGKGRVDYTWPPPVTKNLENKSTYVEKVDDLYVSCGIYK